MTSKVGSRRHVAFALPEVPPAESGAAGAKSKLIERLGVKFIFNTLSAWIAF